MPSKKQTSPKCNGCGREKLLRDEVGACKRLLGRDIKHFYCFDCLAEITGYERDELLAMVEQFKDEGCTLFG